MAGLSDLGRADGWRLLNRNNFYAAEVDTGLAYIPQNKDVAKHNDFLHDGNAFMYCMLEKLFNTKYSWLSKIVEIPLGNNERPSGRFEPEHTQLPAFEPIVSRVYHEEIRRPEFLELITQALPLNENFTELRGIFESRWSGHPILRTMLDQ